MQQLSSWILKMVGWTACITNEEPPKSVICVAPHTSNWDYPIGRLAYWSLGKKSASFLIKKSWFIFPLNYLLKALGGVPVDGSRKLSVTDQMVEEFNKRETFHLAITPEGTRSLTKKWKKGFYYIALKANVPIQLAYLDYAKKEMGIVDIIYPTGDEQADFEKIYAFYKGVQARFPEKFNLTNS